MKCTDSWKKGTEPVLTHFWQFYDVNWDLTNTGHNENPEKLKRRNISYCTTNVVCYIPGFIIVFY